MGRVIDILYGSNLGCGTSQDVFTLASQVLQIEHQLSEAQKTFPPFLRLVEPQELDRETPDTILKFRVVYTLRYHNLRILTHRPLLRRYLEVLSSQDEDTKQMAPLVQMGLNSLRICMQSAGSIVELMSQLTSSNRKARGLFGAWWFSLFYSRCQLPDLRRDSPNSLIAFNAALVLYAGLLIQTYAKAHERVLSLGDVIVRRELLVRAIQCLMSLDKNNPMTEKCARYTSKLDRVLTVLGKPSIPE